MKTITRSFRRLCLLVTLAVLLQQVQAQEPPFYKDIQNFKKLDSVSLPSRNALLFIGSSSFTMWRDVQDYFPGHVIINRGFGGSSLHHLSYYIEDIVYPYHPKQVVVYCGENDLAASDTVSAATVTERFITLFNQIREKYPEVPVAFVSMKPSPSRERLLQKMITANKAIQKFLETQKGTAYIDVYSLMLDTEGRPRRELFLDDMLHMNKQGYEIWQKAFRPYLVQ